MREGAGRRRLAFGGEHWPDPPVMKKKRSRCIRASEVVAGRFVLREPGRGRVRAVLETIPSKPGGQRAVRLRLLSPTGDAVVVVEVSGRGVPRISVGDRDRGSALLLTRRLIELWSGGNAAVALWTKAGQGRCEFLDRRGKRVRSVRRRG